MNTKRKYIIKQNMGIDKDKLDMLLEMHILEVWKNKKNVLYHLEKS